MAHKSQAGSARAIVTPGRVGIAIAGAATAAAIGGFRGAMARRNRALDAGSSLVDTAAGPIEVGREGEGKAALVIHGAGGGYDQGLMLGRELLGEGYDLIAPSRFGYLRTPLPEDLSPEAQARAHAALLDRLGIDRAILVGVSAGAPSAVAFAAQYRERTAALILVVPRAYAPDVVMGPQVDGSDRLVLRLVDRAADFAFWLALRTAPASVAGFLGVPRSVFAAASPPERERLKRIAAAILPLSRRAAGLRAEGAIALGPQPLEQVDAPTLILSTADDLYRSLPGARFAADHIRGAEFVSFPTGGHLLVGRSAEVHALVTAFLQRVMAATAPRRRGGRRAKTGA